jgi:hypothetical protein
MPASADDPDVFVAMALARRRPGGSEPAYNDASRGDLTKVLATKILARWRIGDTNSATDR